MQAAATRQRVRGLLSLFYTRWVRRFSRSVFAWALLISLLIHLLLFSSMHFTRPSVTQYSSVIEARLAPLPTPVPSLSKPSPRKVKRVVSPARRIKRRARVVRHHPAAVPKTPVAQIPVTPPPPPPSVPSPVPPPVIAADAPAAAPPALPQPAPVAPEADSGPAAPGADSGGATGNPAAGADSGSASAGNPADANAPALNKLPDRFQIQYKVVKGINGFTLGRATYIWIAKDGQYTLTSITGGSGLFALFQPGKLVQISRGRITAAGLAPDDFWIQRGRATPDKSTAAHFDYVGHNVTITRDDRAFSVPMQDDAQDLLSAIFQLAVRAPFSGELVMHVTSGKSLKPFHAHIVGEERIDTPLGSLRTLHLVRPAEDGEDAMEVWLAEDYNEAPVKIRIHHSQFGVIEQVVTGMQSH